MTISQANPNQLRPSDDDGHGLIIRVPPDRQPEAVSRLLAAGAGTGLEHAHRFIEYARAHQIDLAGLWSRLDVHGRIESTVLTVPSPGRTAMVFASRAAGRKKIASLAGLIRVATERLANQDVNLAQALLDPAELMEREVFHAAGYRDLAILNYLERLVPGPSAQLPQPAWPQGFATIQFEESMRHELVDVLSASYEDTLDCPGLRGHRRTEDILEGHLATGRFSPRLWTLLRHEGQPVGTILLSSSADRQSIELVYLGLVKSARGRSLGRELLRHGLNLVKGRPERTINLAVDEANAPAARLYAREGFRPALRRRALIYPV